MKIMYRKLILITVTVMLLLCGCSDSKEMYDFDNNKENMETIAVEIVQGKYEISENGLVKLPEEFEHLSDTGEVSLVMFDNKPAVYFWTFRGMLESSKGYIYVLDAYEEELIDKCSDNIDFVNEKEIGEGWYSVSTD